MSEHITVENLVGRRRDGDLEQQSARVVVLFVTNGAPANIAAMRSLPSRLRECKTPSVDGWATPRRGGAVTKLATVTPLLRRSPK